MPAETAAPTIADVRRAAERIAGHAIRTPLIRSAALDEAIGARVFVKPETLQRTGSFKFRGAYNAISVLSREERDRGVVAVSSGNHAQGVAEAARLFGIRATIVMPFDAPVIKRERTIRNGARIVDYDRSSEDRDAVVADFIAADGGVLVHPYNDPNVIAGQGTAGLEIADDCAAMGVRPDVVAIPCSGGGLASGVGLAIRDRFPAVSILLVEPKGFDDYARSLAAGRIVVNDAAAGSICDSLLATSPGAIGFSINRANGASAIAVSDDEALAAVAFAFRELKLVAEPGGAVALAALLSGRVAVKDQTVVLVLSGGNIDPPLLLRALEA